MDSMVNGSFGSVGDKFEYMALQGGGGGGGGGGQQAGLRADPRAAQQRRPGHGAALSQLPPSVTAQQQAARGQSPLQHGNGNGAMANGSAPALQSAA